MTHQRRENWRHWRTLAKTFPKCYYGLLNFFFLSQTVTWKSSFEIKLKEIQQTSCGNKVQQVTISIRIYTYYSSPQNSPSQQWMHNINTAQFSELHTMISFLLGELALLQCVPVMSFDGLFHGIKQCSSKWQNRNRKHIKSKSIKIRLRLLIIK